MKIEVANGRAYVYTPYNPDFTNAIKGIGGKKWETVERCWSVPETAVSAVRAIMEDVYGYSDQVPNDTISLKVIDDNTDGDGKQKLLEEKDRLLKRIAEIDELLGSNP